MLSLVVVVCIMGSATSYYLPTYLLVGEYVVYAVGVSYYILTYSMSTSWLSFSIVVLLAYGVVELLVVVVCIMGSATSYFF
uniref:NADH dehydrogenase subunit 4L n=1 Tax=Lacrimia lanifica TaxID=2016125 RepID=A0A6G5ZUZ8_9EUGL|nr:NADH dehydrogenase subunit 4L [Lacrimia lanifica]